MSEEAIIEPMVRMLQQRLDTDEWQEDLAAVVFQLRRIPKLVADREASIWAEGIAHDVRGELEEERDRLRREIEELREGRQGA